MAWSVGIQLVLGLRGSVGSLVLRHLGMTSFATYNDGTMYNYKVLLKRYYERRVNDGLQTHDGVYA